ncbi:MAG: hypothetical protein R3228_01405 [Halioglobus sp.]|nr:hypothetical protein [Halioglobus sp.]
MKPRRVHLLRTLVALCILPLTAQLSLAATKPAPWVGKQLNGRKCVNTLTTHGSETFDYRDRSPYVAGKLNLVNNAHFNSNVENLVKGKTGSLMADIDFVIRAFPNHHRALNSAVQYSLRFKKWPAGQDGLPAECYLQRAMKFSPTDVVPYKLYGYYMQVKGRNKEALAANEKALALIPNDPMILYNNGLLLVKMKRYEEAMKIARPLYDAGLTLPGLKDKLVKAGHWQHSQAELEKVKQFMEATAAAKAAKSAELDAEAPAAGEAAVEVEDPTATAAEPEAQDTEAPEAEVDSSTAQVTAEAQ